MSQGENTVQNLIGVDLPGLVQRAERGDKKPLWRLTQRLLAVLMRDEPGEALVHDDDGNLVCTVSSKSAHDALVNALMDETPGDLLDARSVLGSDE